MPKPHLALVKPRPVNGTVAKNLPPRRRPNAEVRTREHLLENEVERLIKAAGDNRYGHRDATMILIAYRHALRAVELVNLKWDAIDFSRGEIHVRRVKGSLPSTQPLSGRELRALRRLKREQKPASPYVFVSERGSPFTTAGFRKMVARLGAKAKLGFPVHPHQLRHGTGFKLATDEVNFRALQAYMGHANPSNTMKYTRLAPTLFKGFWKD
jgi:type 1 fimbriae regulatory protein FimB/type 1 fimbriae regulatory protein FimE